MSTVKLSSAQWRDMVLGNLNRVFTYASGTMELGPIDADTMQKALEQTASFVGAWAVSCQPASPVPHEAVKHEAITNGSEPPKKRGGWPKGKPRKAKADEQSAEQH